MKSLKTAWFLKALLVTRSRIERVAQAVAEEVEGGDDEGEGAAGEGVHPPGGPDVGAGGGEHRAPFGGRGLGAESDVAETGGGEDRTGDADGGEDDQRGDDVRHDVADEDAGVTGSDGAGAED